MKTIVSILFFLVLVTQVSLVQAQEEALVATPASDVVVQRQDLSQDMFDLQRSYRGELEEYRRYEREYRLVFEQHAKLQTLASLEALVQATHRVMSTRILVLQTYFRLMKVTVLDAEGINTQHKERLLAALDDASRRIETHKELVAKSQNRTALQQAAVEYEPLHAHLIVVGNYGQTVLMIGRMQNVYDNSVLLLDDVKAEDVSQLSTLEQSQRERATEEIAFSLDKVQQQLLEANNDLHELWQRQASFYEIFYLPETYDTLSKVLSFFGELK